MIEDYAFGKMTVNGATYTSDLKILRGKVIGNWWRKTGHAVVADDVTDILAYKPAILVIGRGHPGQMTSTPSLRRRLKAANIQLIEAPTEEAIEIFNRLFSDGKDVAAGFHLTC